MAKFDFTDKVALVTGASRGIGAEVAKGLAAAGAHVVLLARTQGGLEEVDDEIRKAGGNATLMPMDLRRSEDIDKLGPAIAERFGKLDILVGNAGMLGTLSPLTHIDPKEWQKVMNVNADANFRLLRILDPLLKKSEAGRAVFTHNAVEGFPAYWALYCVSKGMLEGLVKTYAAENEKTDIKANLVNPGLVDTRLLQEAFPGGYPFDVKKPEDVVDTYLGLCSVNCEQSGEIIAA